jgi:predicted nucleic acid-binding protein
MPRFTVDASTILAFLLPELHSPAARRFFDSLTRRDELVEPAFMFVECTSNLRRKVVEGILPAAEAQLKLSQALRIQVKQITDLRQHEVALDLAHRRGTVRAYDEHYLAVASQERTEVVTIDSGMYQGAVNFRIPARLLR